MERLVHGQDRLEIIEALKRTPDTVEEEIGGLSDSVLRYRPVEGEWSIKEVVGHLRDKVEIWGRRLYMVTSQTDPVLPAFDQEASVREKAYQEGDVRQLIAEMRELTLKVVSLLDHTVDWTCLGQHPEMGRRSLHQFTEVLAAGEADHLRQIRTLKAAAGAQVREHDQAKRGLTDPQLATETLPSG